MLTPEYLNSFSSGYLGMCDVLNEQIIRDVARRIAKLRQHDEDFVTVTEYADNTIRGTDRTKHWRIGGA